MTVAFGECAYDECDSGDWSCYRHYHLLEEFNRFAAALNQPQKVHFDYYTATVANKYFHKIRKF
jgi:hypothetical protein